MKHKVQFQVGLGDMKKSLLLFSLSLITYSAFSQAFKTVKIDSLVTVTLPAVYNEKDTLGRQTFTAKSAYGFIVIARIPNAPHNPPLKKEKDLKKIFKAYVKEVVQVGNGSLLDERDTTVGTLKAHLFTLKTQDDNGDVQFRKFLFIYTNDASYSFQYFYKEGQVDMISDEVKSYFNSIKLAPGLQRDDQYLTSNGKGLPGGLKALLFGGGGFIVVLIIIFATIRRRKRKKVA
jgi:hypothetical protein